jgi:hypothetical protein
LAQSREPGNGIAEDLLGVGSEDQFLQAVLSVRAEDDQLDVVPADDIVENIPEFTALGNAFVDGSAQGVAVEEVIEPSLRVVPLAVEFKRDRFHGKKDRRMRSDRMGDEDTGAVDPGERLGIRQCRAGGVTEVRGKENVAERKAEAGLEGRHRNLLGAIRVARTNPALRYASDCPCGSDGYHIESRRYDAVWKRRGGVHRKFTILQLGLNRDGLGSFHRGGTDHGGIGFAPETGCGHSSPGNFC